MFDIIYLFVKKGKHDVTTYIYIHNMYRNIIFYTFSSTVYILCLCTSDLNCIVNLCYLCWFLIHFHASFIFATIGSFQNNYRCILVLGGSCFSTTFPNPSIPTLNSWHFLVQGWFMRFVSLHQGTTQNGFYQKDTPHAEKLHQLEISSQA